VILSVWRWLRTCGSAEQAEAEACLQGLRLAAEWIQQPIWVESDCELLIPSLRKTDGNRSSNEGILREIQAVKNILPDCKFGHTRRHMNRVAHSLAQEAIRKRQSVVMRYDAPQCARKLIDEDRASIAGNPLDCKL
jgi:ribonuclease HI